MGSLKEDHPRNMMMFRPGGSFTSLRMLPSTLATAWKTFSSTETGCVTIIINRSIKTVPCIIISIISLSKCMIVIQICCSIYDIVDKQDHPTLHLHLARYHLPPPPHCHHFHHHQCHHHHCHHPHNHDDGQGGRWWERERVAKVNLKSQTADFPLQVKPVRLLIKYYHHGDHIVSYWSYYCHNHTIYIWE